MTLLPVSNTHELVTDRRQFYTSYPGQLSLAIFPSTGAVSSLLYLCGMIRGMFCSGRRFKKLHSNMGLRNFKNSDFVYLINLKLLKI